MKVDTHLHSEISFDSELPLAEMAETAIAKGLDLICITDHMDEDLLCPDGTKQTFDPDDYFEKVSALQAAYAGKLTILTGMEYGMMPHLPAHLDRFLEDCPFDFVIGSQHVVNGQDPFYPEAFEGKTDAAVYRAYFEETLENLQRFPQIDSLGHLDYIVRYGKQRAAEYSYDAFADVIDEILRTLIRQETALEVNTAGIGKIGFTNPHPDVLRRYHELGGRLVTIGSDAHNAQRIGDAFDKTARCLKDIGFTQFCYYQKHTPTWVAL